MEQWRSAMSPAQVLALWATEAPQQGRIVARPSALALRLA
jgi:hypothetical protein